MNFVVSVNDNSIYYGFLEKVVELYKNLGHSISVAYVTKDKLNPLDDLEVDNLIVIPEVDGYEPGIQAKLARSFFASKLDEGVVYTLLDVDQFVITFDWVSHNINLQDFDDIDLIAFGANGYDVKPYNPNINGKFPMSYTTGKPEGFRKIFGIDKNIEFEAFLNKFDIIENPRDGFESTRNEFSHFSDESLFAWLIRENDIKIKHIDVPGFVELRHQGRIDRTISIMLSFGTPNFGPDFWNQKELTQEQKNMIYNNWFIDVVPARPYEDHKDLVDDIIKTIIERETPSDFLIPNQDFENISSEPYVSAYTFATISNHMWLGDYKGTPYLNKYNKQINPNSVKSGDILYVKTSEFVQFMRQVDPHINCKYTLICGMGDEPFDNSLTSLLSDNVIKVFATNNISDDSRVTSIPLGLQNLHWLYDNNPQSNFNLIDDVNLESIEKTEKVLMSFRMETNPKDREPCYRYFQNKSFVNIRDFTQENRKDEQFVKDYFREIRKHKFILCPFGNGFDCHRMWETWALGSFPIIKKHKSMENFYDLPAWFVDDWDEVTEETIDVMYDSIVENESSLEKNTFEYWENLILE
jgi:hypothetical protein